MCSAWLLIARSTQRICETLHKRAGTNETPSWYASKLAPKQYGDRVQHANADGDADPVVHITYSWTKPEEPQQE
jgi:hypothetical protein